MFEGDSEADEIIAKDRKNFPGCGYSTNMKTTCGTEEGNFVCKTLKSIQRNCPGEHPVNVYNKTTEGDSNVNIFGDLFGLARKGKQVDKKISKGELEHDIKEVQKSLEEVLGGGHHDLKGIFDELMKEAHRKPQQQQQQQQPRAMPRERVAHHRSRQKHHQPQPQLPYSQEYDKLVEEAMGGLLDDTKQSSSLGGRKGTKDGSIEEI